MIAKDDLRLDCPPVLCCIRECIIDMLGINGDVKSVCRSDEEILFNLGSSDTQINSRKLGGCAAIETRNVELVFHITAKQCDTNEECRTLFIQRWIEEVFSENSCFCHQSSREARLVDSDVIREFRDKKGRQKVVRQLVFELPYKIRNGNPQVHIKCCNHDAA